MPPIYYVAYGSNLHPVRIEERVPSAQALGVVELLGMKLAFHKRSIDKSGKCLLYTKQEPPAMAYGVLYAIDPNHKGDLDRAEGSGNGYFAKQVTVPLGGQDYQAFIYMASSSHINTSLDPYHWYKNLVLAGAHFHNFPKDYIALIESNNSIEDQDSKRRQKNEDLLIQMGWQQ
jgi:gamma-glutamylcyclotransferase